MRYQKDFVQNKVRVLGDAHSRAILNGQRGVVGRHIIHKKDGVERVLKGKRSHFT